MAQIFHSARRNLTACGTTGKVSFDARCGSGDAHGHGLHSMARLDPTSDTDTTAAIDGGA
jgi:hypothetical protein